MVSYKEQLKSANLNNYLDTNKDFEGLLKKRLLSVEEKNLVKVYLGNPQGLNDHQASVLFGDCVDKVRSLRDSMNVKLGTHLLVNDKTNLWRVNKHHNYNGGE